MPLSSMDGKKKFLMWTILLIAMVQMPSLALTPGINQIQKMCIRDRLLTDFQVTQFFVGSSQLGDITHINTILIENAA